MGSRHMPQTGPQRVQRAALHGILRQMHSEYSSHSGRSTGHEAVTSGGMAHFSRSLVMPNA